MEINKLVNLINWNYSYFNSENFKAFISFSGVERDGATSFLYSPTVLDTKEKEVFQKDFSELDQAIDYMNKNYAHWGFVDPGAKEGGCSSCEAH